MTDLLAALQDVQDPEFPISIVDMGLVRGVSLDDGTAHIKLTYTSMGCPCQDLIKADVRERLLRLEDVHTVEIEEVFEEWTRANLSRRGVKAMRELGVG